MGPPLLTQCLHTLRGHCPIKLLAIIRFDRTLDVTAKDVAAPLTAAPGFKAFKVHPTLRMGVQRSTEQLKPKVDLNG